MKSRKLAIDKVGKIYIYLAEKGEKELANDAFEVLDMLTQFCSCKYKLYDREDIEKLLRKL